MDIVDKVAEAIEDIPGNPTTTEIARVAIEEYQKALWTPAFNPHTLYPELRRARANALTAHIMHLVGKYICEHGEQRNHRDASETLFEAIYESGAEIVTDLDRRNAGLEERGAYGLTREQLRILEMKRMEAMLAPLPSIVLAHR